MFFPNRARVPYAAGITVWCRIDTLSSPYVERALCYTIAIVKVMQGRWPWIKVWGPLGCSISCVLSEPFSRFLILNAANPMDNPNQSWLQPKPIVTSLCTFHQFLFSRVCRRFTYFPALGVRSIFSTWHREKRRPSAGSHASSNCDHEATQLHLSDKGRRKTAVVRFTQRF